MVLGWFTGLEAAPLSAGGVAAARWNHSFAGEACPALQEQWEVHSISGCAGGLLDAASNS